MLVLSRKVNESIIIDGNIVVTVVGIIGDKVRIGVKAPKEIAVHRKEIQEKVDESNRRNNPLHFHDSGGLNGHEEEGSDEEGAGQSIGQGSE